MGIKRLISEKCEVSGFVLGRDNALVLVETQNSQFECLYIDELESTDLSKINKIGEIKSLKFVGGESILKALKNHFPHWPDFIRTVTLDGPTKAFYYPEHGSVRIERNTLPEARGKKKVLIIDDSKVIQKLLSEIINKSSELEVMAVCDRAENARQIIERERPDIITLDIHLPEINGVDFYKSYIRHKHIPTVVISSVSQNEGPHVIEALSSGVVSYIQKPSLGELEKVAGKIITELEEISQSQASVRAPGIVSKTLLSFEKLNGLVVIGSSTGGTLALEEILTSLPARIPPIAIVQHIPAVFSRSLAERLNDLCPFTVKEAEDGDILRENTVYIAPGGRQTKIIKAGSKKKLVICDDPPFNGFCPSVDYLFNSIPALKERNLVGIILTGMGKDGAKGLLKLRQNGASTIAQDEKSCVVFGMPKEAIRLGAAQRVIPVNQIGHELVFEFNKLLDKKVA